MPDLQSDSVSPGLRAMLDGVKSCPEDNDARLVLADWLEEHAETEAERARAEFVRLQVHLAALPDSHPDLDALRERQGRLEQAFRVEWLGALHADSLRVSFQRGLVRLRADCDPAGRRDLLAASRAPGWPWVEELELRDLNSADLASQIEASSLAQVAKLSLLGNSFNRSTARQLVETVPFYQLSTLILRGNRVDAAAIQALAEAPFLGQLTAFTMGGSFRIRAAEIRTLVHSAGWKRLTCLDLGNNQLSTDGMIAITASSVMKGVRRLCLYQNSLGPREASVLAQAPFLAGLTSLDLNNNSLGDKGAQALAESPYLSQLVSLSLDFNGIREEGVRFLVESTNLARLTCLSMWDYGGDEEAKRLLRKRFGDQARFYDDELLDEEEP